MQGQAKWGATTIMRKVYDLREDTQALEEIQSGTLDTGDFGIVPEHGSIGSSEWWRAIEQGDFPAYALEGVISDVFLSEYHDYPQFEVDDGQHKSQWTRAGDDSVYVVGRPVLIEYVVAGLKPRGPGAEYAEYAELGLDKAEIMLAVWVG